MEFTLNKSEVENLNNMILLGSSNLSDARFTIELRHKIVRQFQYQIIADFKGIDLSDKENKSSVRKIIESPTEREDIFLQIFSKGLSTALLMGFLQSFKSDRQVQEDSSEFGYALLDESLTCIRNIEMSEFADVTKTASLIQTGLFVNLRDISAEEYFAQGLYHNDIELLSNIMVANIDDGYNVDMLTAISNKDDIKLDINSYMTDLEAIYNYMFEDGFGIHPYHGVLANKNEFLEISDDNKGVVLTKSKGIMRDFSTRIGSKLEGKVIYSNSRQFNYDEIYSNKSEQVVYFPYKMLEYALGRESSLNLNKYVYLPNANSASWGSYYKDYVANNLRNILIRGFYKALELVLLKNGVIEDSFISNSFTSKHNNCLEFLNDVYYGDVARSVRSYIVKLIDSMKCMYILTQFNYLAGSIANLGLRVTNSPSFNCFLGTEADTINLFKNLVGNNSNEEFNEPFNLSDSRRASDGKNLSVTIYDFKYEINPLLAKAEPLFGYVVQQQNQKKGKASDWNNILIGESIAGKELYSKPSGDINLQDHFVHNIFAGSRSGKGVMTMNILVSAIAAGKPIFYLDRKPDMGSMLYHLSGGNMFVVNGGNILSEFDIHGDFNEDTGNAMHYWRKTVKYLESNPKMKELFGTSAITYKGVLGDLIYLRAFMFCYGLTLLRAQMKGVLDDERNSIFNGDDGIVIVVDELTGFQGTISGLLSSVDSPFIKKALESADLDEILNKTKEIDNKIEVLNLKIEEAKLASKQLELQNQIEALEVSKRKLIDEQSLYAITFFKKIRESYEEMKTAKVANFKNKEFNYSDVFVLGQDLTNNYFLEGDGSLTKVFFPMTSTGKDYYASAKNGDIIRSFLDMMGECDWFLGRNPQYSYGDKGYNKTARKYVDDDGNWEYISRAGLSARDIHKGTYKDLTSVLFKAYLVLNEKDEENPANTRYDDKGNPIPSDPIFQYTTQCIDRTNKSAGGIDLWSTVRVKHLTEDAKAVYSESNPCYNCLQEGVGFRGLVRETLKTTGNSIDDEGIAAMLSKSNDIANYVARKMGFENWQDLIFDLSPRGLFSMKDMVLAVVSPDKYSLESRLSMYSKLGLLGDLGGQGVESQVSSSEPDIIDPDSLFDDEDDIEEESDIELEGDFDFDNESSDGWVYEGGSSNDSDLPFTREELAEAMVDDMAPNIRGLFRQKAIELVLAKMDEEGFMI